MLFVVVVINIVSYCPLNQPIICEADYEGCTKIGE